MMPTELDLIRSALAAHRAILADLDALVPAWPLGLPTWSDEWIAMFLNGPTSSYLTLWHGPPPTRPNTARDTVITVEGVLCSPGR